ncbi:uncharacterized protein LOC121877340 [Homarus americanus]|uniref:F-box only protein 21-like 1 n=1 Tax=Homarus americanus TaxID=6706 RepID=A0A8J5JR75_HOMAM|nr:uncharacterized protein LOC121877340 [Homarus americanus]KAG7159433.1 F-box only protein 21-like 1 [Homarus americanus]
MEECVTIDNLPYEVLERILTDICVNVEDVVSCSVTCKYFHGVCQRNSLWKKKLSQHYSYVYQHSELVWKEKLDWKSKYVSLYRCKKKLLQCILALSRTFVWSMYHDYEWPDIPRRALTLYETLFTEELGEANLFYILDECHNIMNTGPQCMDLTLKYYAGKLYNHIYERCVINSEWKKFIAQPEESLKYSYEEGLLWVVVSLRPTHSEYDINKVKLSLDKLACETLKYIKEKYPDNPVSSKMENKCDFLKGCSSFWKGEHCCDIVQAVHHVIKHKSGFKINNSLYESGPDHYCIDQVLLNRKGSSKLLLIIESCIADRLGVHAEVHKNITDHVLDTWKLYYVGQDGVSGYSNACDLCKKDPSSLRIVLNDWQEGQTVDAAGMCQAIIQQIVFLAECWLKGERWQAGEPVLYDLLDEETYNQPIRLLFTAWQHVEHWKMSRLYHYMHQLLRVNESHQTLGKLLHLSILLRINSKLTLEKLLNFRRRMGQPPNTMRDLLRMLASVDKRARTRVSELKTLLSTAIASYSSLNPLASVPWPHGWPGGEMVQKRRVDRKSWQVQFAVGEVLEQRGGDLCVVYDWDSMCVESEDTLVLMGETGLAHGTDQPFYRVLTDGGSARYLAQENLRHARQPQHLRNPLIGRYFTAFIYPFYIPNPQKAYEYPEDANIREQNALTLKLKFAVND